MFLMNRLQAVPLWPCKSCRFSPIQRSHTTAQFPLSSFDYEDAGYEPAELIKIDFLLNGKPVEELTTIVHK